MKKLLSVLLTLLLCLNLCACGESEGSSKKETETSNLEETTTEESPKTSQSTPAEIKEGWKLDYYVDEFNEPTSEAYIHNKEYIIGNFSNSATTNSVLHSYFLIDNDNISIVLKEYGWNQVKNSSSRTVDAYLITMKTDDGTRYELTGTMYCGSDRIVIDANYRQMVIDALLGTSDVSFYIVNKQYQTTKYLFTVPASNFSALYQKL